MQGRRAHRGGHGQHPERVLDLLEVRAIGDAEGDIDAALRVGECPVDQLAGYEFFIGHDHLAAVPE
ncbi:MAG: hypothetical protein V3W10_04315, partial [candidate division NC10 bacterium]